MAAGPPGRLLFAGFSLDLGRLALVRDGSEVPLRPKSFDVLRHLAENAGRVISKEELNDKVWSGAFVTDDSLVQCVKEIREAIGDQRHVVVRTVPRRGYLFAALVTEERLQEGAAPSVSPVRYAKSGALHIAYQLWGEGRVPVLFCPGFITHIENLWTEPALARYLRRMGEFARIVMFDKRGTGMSDRAERLPGMDERVDDVRAVLDAVGMERPVVMGPSEGGSLAAYFAAMHPERCRALVLYGAFARFSSWMPSEQALQDFFRYVESGWGSGGSAQRFAPSKAGDESFRQWWGRFERLGASPSDAIALMRMNSQIDITDILPNIQVPTLVIHRTGDVTVNVEGGRLLAARIPHARLVELPGADHLFWIGDNADEILRLVKAFVLSESAAPALDAVLATVLALDRLPSVAAHERSVRQELARFGGRLVNAELSCFCASFEAPSRALRAALAIRAALARLGPQVRIGIHIGEVQQDAHGIHGHALTVAQVLMKRARPGEILLSRTVKDLVAGSAVTLELGGQATGAGLADSLPYYRAVESRNG